MGVKLPIARERLVSSNKNVCGECAGCMLSFVCMSFRLNEIKFRFWVIKEKVVHINGMNDLV